MNSSRAVRSGCLVFSGQETHGAHRLIVLIGLIGLIGPIRKPHKTHFSIEKFAYIAQIL